MEVAEAGLLVCQSLSHVGGHEVGEVRWQLDGGVVLDDVVLDQFDGQMWEVAQFGVPGDAAEVLVLAAVAGSPGVDELAATSGLLTSEAVELLLEGSGSGCGRAGSAPIVQQGSAQRWQSVPR